MLTCATAADDDWETGTDLDPGSRRRLYDRNLVAHSSYNIIRYAIHRCVMT